MSIVEALALKSSTIGCVLNFPPLEIPTSVFPTAFIETLPPPPTEDEVRQHVNQQVEHLLKGEHSDLLLSSNYQWTNISIESLILPTNFAQRYPHKTEAVLLAQGLHPNTKTPLQYHLHPTSATWTRTTG